MGNVKAAEIYEANIPSGYPRPNPSDSAAIEKWIRDKYEPKRFMGPQKPQTRRNSGGGGAGAAPRPVAVQENERRKIPTAQPLPAQIPAPVPAQAPKTVPTSPPPAAVGSLLLPIQQQSPPQQPQQPVQQSLIQNAVPPQQLQGLKIPTAEEQVAAKKATLLQMYDQPQQQPHLQQQQQMQQQQQAMYAAYAQQAAYLQQMGQPMYYDPRLGGMQVMYGYPYGYNPAVQANTGMGVGQTTLSTEKDTRQNEFASLFT